MSSRLKNRPDFLKKIAFSFRVHPAVSLLGPRQCGKTTLARMYAKKQKDTKDVHFFDLEDPEDLVQLQNPKLALSPLKGLIVIDEIQRLPDLFPILRVLIDDPSNQRKFLILGSASRDLIQQSSESLAGRIGHIELFPFSYEEVPDLEKLWVRGGFPHSYLAETLPQSVSWRKEYISTYLERDIPNLGFHIPAESLRRFWMMLAHYHGNYFNASELGRSLQHSTPTIRRYLDLLTGTFMVRQLLPWFENISKRQVKSPKIYFRDSGIFHTLLNLNEEEEIRRHPKLGASWEGFALESVIRAHGSRPEECFFWAVHEQGELDLLLFEKGERIGFEFKWADAPRLSRSMQLACDTLNLAKLTVIYPGKKSYPLTEKVTVIGLQPYLDRLKNV